MFCKRMAVAALAVVGLSTPLVAIGATAPSAGAATGAVTISGKLAGVTVSSRVLVLSLGGRAWESAPLSGGAFRISIPSAARNALTNATVQVLSAKGVYMGPVVLAKGLEIANPACKTHKSTCPTDDYLGFSAIKKATNVSIGTLRAKSVTKGTPAWFLASKVSSKYIGTYIVRAKNKTGEPYGAGTDGFLKRGIPDAKVGTKGRIKAHVDGLGQRPSLRSGFPSPARVRFLPTTRPRLERTPTAARTPRHAPLRRTRRSTRPASRSPAPRRVRASTARACRTR